MHCAFGLHSTGFEQASKGDKAHHSAGVIAYSGRAETPALTPHSHVGAFGKNSVEVSRYDHARARVAAWSFGYNIALAIDASV
jgi:hypothetical protein